LNTNKLVAGGHSFGGITAISVAHHDNRVKAVFSFDPWLFPCLQEIKNEQFKVDQPQIHIVTEGFGPVVEKIFNYDTQSSVSSIAQFEGSKKQEVLILKGCNHYHQADLICLVPMEAFIRSGTKPQSNVGELYMLNT